MDVSLQYDTLTCYRTNQFLLLFLNAVGIAEKHQYQFYSVWFDPTWGSNPRSTTLDTSTLAIIPPMWFIDLSKSLLNEKQKLPHCRHILKTDKIDTPNTNTHDALFLGLVQSLQ